MKPQDQVQMFGGRGSSQVGGGSSTPGFSFMWSTTWAYRRSLIDDFKVRALCPGKAFRARRSWNRADEDGDPVEWVFTKPGSGVHVRGPDGQPLTRKMYKPGTMIRTYPENGYGVGGYIREYDPKWPEFPSHDFPSHRDYAVTGDDGTRWKVGSRGNDLAVLRQEILCNEFLWPEEKTEILTWLDGDRKLRVERDIAGEVDAIDKMIRLVDGYYAQRIMQGPLPTEDEIRASGLPDRTIENLLDNLRNYSKFQTPGGSVVGA